MAQTREGAIKIAAKKIGITVEEYIEKITNGLKWCYKCNTWKLTDAFGVDKSRWDGLNAKCFDCCRVKERKSTKGQISAFKGKQHTEEAKQKLSVSHKGKQPRLGIKHTVETRIKISKIARQRSRKGDQCHSFKDGKAHERRGMRHSTEYKRWRFDVFSRDKFTCQRCGDNKGGNLNAHHIKPFADFPRLRYDIDNGITLCDNCHRLEHYGK